MAKLRVPNTITSQTVAYAENFVGGDQVSSQSCDVTIVWCHKQWRNQRFEPGGGKLCCKGPVSHRLGTQLFPKNSHTLHKSSFVRSTYIWLYVFEHTPFVVNRTFNDTLTERLEQRVLE